MTDATILIPTHRHAALLPYAVRSALAQEGVDIEVFVVGDGVEDDTRQALAPFLSDPHLRFSNAFDLGQPEFVELLAVGRGGGGLTGVAHTRDAYNRLPFGWRPAPASVPTDVYMWQQFLAIPGFRGATGDRLTSLVFPSLLRTHMTDDERTAELPNGSS